MALNLTEIFNLSKTERNKLLLEFNLQLQYYSAEKRVNWALDNLPCNFILSSSFGLQSSVLLHMITQQKPNIPVVLIDTGYLFPETYHFIDTLTEKFNLNLCIFRAKISPAWQEARYGKLWEQGITGIEKYNDINKIQPMNLAIKSLSAKTWFAGLRRVQSVSRTNLAVLDINRGIFKLLPIIDWDNQKVHFYIKRNNLSYHPLLHKGYLSIGDIHTTTKCLHGMSEEETRFFGLKRECGLHTND